MKHFGTGLLVVLIGSYFAAAGFFDWDFFMQSRRLRKLVASLGRDGARTFYIVLGLVFVVVGALTMTGLFASFS